MPIDNPNQPIEHHDGQSTQAQGDEPSETPIDWDDMPPEWNLPSPEGSDPRDIDIKAIETLRKKVFSGLTESEVHQLSMDTLILLPAEQKLFEFARYAELFLRHPDLAQKWKEVYER